MFRKKPRKTTSQEIKARARRSLNIKVSIKKKKYVIDTSILINRVLGKLIKKGIQGEIIIPNAVIAELENLANKGMEEGFLGLEEIAHLHYLKKAHNIKIFFEGLRPSAHEIKFAKSGEIDALIREIAFRNKAVLATADLVQAKSAQAYGLEVLFFKFKPRKIKKRFLFRR